MYFLNNKSNSPQYIHNCSGRSGREVTEGLVNTYGIAECNSDIRITLIPFYRILYTLRCTGKTSLYLFQYSDSSPQALFDTILCFPSKLCINLL